MNKCSYIRKDISFYTNTTKCAGWLYVPDGDSRPVIVMAHGLGGTRDMLDPYAQFFAEAGYACLLFDYRNFGASDGNKRQRINAKDQLQDWDSAIEYVKNSPFVDGKQIILFGTSFSGGHVIIESYKHPELKAAISQCPYTDGTASIRSINWKSKTKIYLKLVLDLLSCLTGYHPVMINVVDAPSTTALVTTSEFKKYLDKASINPDFKNFTPARTGLEFLKYTPGKYAKDVKIPVYYAVCDQDIVAPAKKTLFHVSQAHNATIKHYSCGHFSIYDDSYFKIVTKDYLKFLDQIINI